MPLSTNNPDNPDNPDNPKVGMGGYVGKWTGDNEGTMMKETAK